MHRSSSRHNRNQPDVPDGEMSASTSGRAIKAGDPLTASIKHRLSAPIPRISSSATVRSLDNSPHVEIKIKLSTPDTAQKGQPQSAGKDLERKLSETEKVSLLFASWDKDGDGYLNEQDLTQAVKASASASRVHLTDQQVEHAVDTLMAQPQSRMESFSACSSPVQSPSSPADPPSMTRPAKKLPAKKLTLEEFEMLLARYGQQADLITDPRSTAPAPQSKARQNMRRFWQWCRRRVKGYWWYFRTRKGVFMIFLAIAMMCMFAWGVKSHDDPWEFEVIGWSWAIAHGFAYVIRLTMALLLLTVSSRLLTFLRATPLNLIIPFDDAISIHVTLGYIFYLSGLGHGICHVVHAQKYSDPVHAQAFIDGNRIQPTLHSLYHNDTAATGLTMLSLMSVMLIFAVAHVNRFNPLRGTRIGRFLGSFQMFFYSHTLMWIVVVLLLLLHPLPALPTTHNGSLSWMFVAVPLILFLTERTYRTWIRGRRMEVVSVLVLSSTLEDESPMDEPAIDGVTQLVLRTPPGQHPMRYKPGQYVYVQVEELSKQEWHPFTITSAPEDEFMTIHVANKGDWKEKMFQLADQAEATHSNSSALSHVPMGLLPGTSQAKAALLPTTESEMQRSHVITPTWRVVDLPGADATGISLERMESQMLHQQKVPLTIKVDGPYGAPAQHFMDYEVIVMISTGIGVTPMISILRHLLHQFNAQRCKHCNKVTMNKDFWMTKLYFHWIVREQGAPQWFQHTLTDVATLAPGDMCDINIHYTPAGRPSPKNLALRMAQNAEQEQNGIFMLTGVNMKAQTSFGRPDMREVVGDLVTRHPKAQVGVLYCGAPEVGNQLHKAIKKSGHKHMILHREVF